MASQENEKGRIDAAFPDRSAGRWCAHCEQHGSHHTERHENFLATAREHTNPSPGPCWRSECRTACYYPQACSEVRVSLPDSTSEENQ